MNYVLLPSMNQTIIFWCHWVITIFLPVFLGTEDVNEIKNLRSKKSRIFLPNFKLTAICSWITKWGVSFLHWCVLRLILVLQFDEAYTHRKKLNGTSVNPSMTFSLMKLIIDNRDMYDKEIFKQFLRVLIKKCPINDLQEIIFYCDTTWLLGYTRKGSIFGANPLEKAARISQRKANSFVKNMRRRDFSPKNIW